DTGRSTIHATNHSPVHDFTMGTLDSRTMAPGICGPICQVKMRRLQELNRRITNSISSACSSHYRAPECGCESTHGKSPKGPPPSREDGRHGAPLRLLGGSQERLSLSAAHVAATWRDRSPSRPKSRSFGVVTEYSSGLVVRACLPFRSE